jgi:hypothetical protein
MNPNNPNPGGPGGPGKPGGPPGGAGDDKKAKKNPAPVARPGKRRKKKGPSNAVKIPQGTVRFDLVLFFDGLWLGMYNLNSVSHFEVQAAAAEVGEN